MADIIGDLRSSVAPAERNIVAMLTRAALSFGDAPFITAPGGSCTFAEALDLVARRAGALAAAGVKRGDVIAVISENHFDPALTFLASGWLGCTFLPINTACKGPQIDEFLRRSGAVLLAVQTPLVGALALVDFSQLSLSKRWVMGEQPLSPALDRALEVDPRFASPIPPAEAKAGDSLLLMFTSGTTGPAKGVVCSHAQLFWWGAHGANQLQLKRSDVLHTTLPMFHINALSTLLQALLLGCSVVLEERFSASKFYARIKASGATVTYVLGAMVPILMSRDRGDEEKSHCVLRALGPGIPADRRQEFERRTNIALIDGFGSTETNFVIGWRYGEARGEGMGMGCLLDGFEARVVDGDDVAVADGTPGELTLRALDPHAFMTEYHEMPAATVAATRNLWFHTGDRVVRRPDGSFHFVDRIKDVIRRRGENVSSFEIERILNAHPDIALSAAYPVGSEMGEDEVMVAVQLTHGHELSERELIDYCVPRMPYFAVPRFVAIVEELPRTPTGKIEKYKLRNTGTSSGAWDREQHGIKVSR